MEPTPAKQPCYLRSAGSPAFARYCKEVYGESLNQYGTADIAQLTLLLDTLALTPGSRVLDAGCGTGETTAWLCRQSAAHFTGFDKSEQAIGHARTIGAPANGRLDFQVADMDALEFPAASFDAVIAVESLYFPKDLAATIGAMKNLLRPGGCMGLFFTHVAETKAGPAETKLGVALAANDLHHTAHDLTESDRRFWQRSRETAEAMLSEFEAEGNADLLHLGETTAVLGMIEKCGHARYLYDVRA